jgi:Mg2+/Co2+ transporter CorB
LNDTPLSALLLILAILLVLSGFFSMAETSMMALNRYRLKHLVSRGHRGARLANQLLQHTDRLLGVLLLGNNFINAAAATLVTVVAVRLVGNGELVLTLSTVLVTLFILVFSEITPKILGAAYSEKIALTLSYILVPLLRICYPIVWFVNLFVQGLLRLTRLKPKADSSDTSLSLEELRVVVLEGGHFIPRQHHRILLNLLGLQDITVDDVMTPRHEIEGVDLESPLEEIRHQLATAHHTQQLVYRGEPDEVCGILHVRRVLNQFHEGELNLEDLQSVMQEPYFIPAGTPLLTQLQKFQQFHQQVGLVVDEYGVLQGLVTVEDILEEIVGEFGERPLSEHEGFNMEADGSVMVEGGCSLRDLNRKLGTRFDVSGPRTLNGLILEAYEDIPEAGIALKINHCPVEIVQTQGRKVLMARLHIKALEQLKKAEDE